MKAIGIYLTLSIQIYWVLDLRYRQRRNKSKKADERDETMGFSAMDEILIKSRCLWICNNFNLHYITHYSDINLRNGKELNQFTGKRKSASIGIQNDVFKSETKERSKGLISKESQNLNSLTKYLSEIKSTKMEEEYKVCWTKHQYLQM